MTIKDLESNIKCIKELMLITTGTECINLAIACLTLQDSLIIKLKEIKHAS